MGVLYFEDIELHKKEILAEFVVDREEMVEFSRKWDPQPFHIDEEAAQKSPYGGLIAPIGYVMGMINRILTEKDQKVAGMGGLGKDKMRYGKAIRPGDNISVTIEYLHKRESQSMPDIGIVQCAAEAKNQNDETVLTFEATFMAVMRPH